ncbi:glucose dehydrogenase [FAD, quinone]-like [Helicoverpa zea]|uniref:glucose dehydrogenase [FAD, quinone]-like n=1 Tax=Helicoverpa zea TaxID=7113 RepID=UPI001F597A55|nr:glucose dehydrogenase [FAD, quinone]-like [Helicoverpa zea]
MWQRIIWSILIFSSIIDLNTITCQNDVSFLQNPVINLLMQTAAPNYSPQNPGDLFDILRDRYPLPNGLKSPLPEYDYIIVGAGSAGCVLAARLTENPNVTVLLIEAGRPENFFTDVPSIAPFFQITEYAWPYYMEPQPGVCLGLVNKRCYWPRGRAVGGTSVINYMIYTRGRPEEWDRIADAGNYGWSYEEVLKYYMKSETANLRGYENSPYRGRNGEMDIQFVNFKTPLIEAFLEAGRMLGSPTIDYNAPDQLGFGYVQTNIRNGRRLSAAKAFLRPNKGRPNLHILHSTVVTKVLINKNTRTASGVEYNRNRLRNVVRARREVILSAGPIASPQLLMLSGIGPKEHLKSHGIPTIRNLPVGRTLYDHITYAGLIFPINVTNVGLNENKDGNVPNFLEWLQSGDNVVATPGGVEGIGYIKTHLSNSQDRIPDIELISLGGSITADGGATGSKALRRGMMISQDTFDRAFGPIDNLEAWSVFPMLLHPRSVGYLELKDRNPFSHPRMFGNYLTHPLDVANLIAAVRHVQALAATPPFQRFGAKLHRANFPTCQGITYDSDEYWECAFRSLTITLHHQIGTCRMGPVGDPLAVVDPELRVHGFKNLRVIDSSVIPRTISAHTHAPAVMIGEKGADMIKTTWN